MTEPLLDIALRDVTSTDQFLAHLRSKATELETNVQMVTLGKLQKVIGAVEELRDYQASTVNRLQNEIEEDQSDLG